MAISSRTPEGEPNRCPVCQSHINIELSQPFGDAPCPSCGHLLWFTGHGDRTVFYDGTVAEIKRNRTRQLIAQQLGVPLNKIPENFQKLDLSALGVDSLDFVELVMTLEEEFDD